MILASGAWGIQGALRYLISTVSPVHAVVYGTFFLDECLNPHLVVHV